MTEEIKIKIITALRHKYSEYNNLENIGIEINRTSDKSHGDFYTNIAMKLAKTLKKILLILPKKLVKTYLLTKRLLKLSR